MLQFVVDFSHSVFGGHGRALLGLTERSFQSLERHVAGAVRGPHGQFALFSVTKACRDDEWAKLIASYSRDFVLLAQFAHQQALRFAESTPEPQDRPLSGRERDALLLLSDGSSRAQAADSLGISENTLRVYIDSARHKLGALNVPHAIAIAAYRGVLVPQ